MGPLLCPPEPLQHILSSGARRDPQPSPDCLLPLPPTPQLRRSPIKKVRKSLALDIVDEDGKLMMSSLPKTLSLVRGCETPSPRELRRLLCPRGDGRSLELCLCGPEAVGGPWGWSGLVVLGRDFRVLLSRKFYLQVC